jgi:hypothetical protein
MVPDRKLTGTVFALECGSKNGLILLMGKETKLYCLLVARNPVSRPVSKTLELFHKQLRLIPIKAMFRGYPNSKPGPMAG